MAPVYVYSSNDHFRLEALKPPGTDKDQETVKQRYPELPQEYFELVALGSYLEFCSADDYLRIRGPQGILTYGMADYFAEDIPGSMPVGDDGGDYDVFYWEGPRGFGVYQVESGSIDPDEAEWIAGSLKDLIRFGYHEAARTAEAGGSQATAVKGPQLNGKSKPG